jgi:hypothetical protein
MYEPREEQVQETAQTYDESAQEQTAAYEPESASARASSELRRDLAGAGSAGVGGPAPAPAPSPPRAVDVEPVPVRARGGLNPLVLGLGAVVLVLVGAVGWLLTRGGGDGGLNENVGELVVQSRPEGAQVKIDGDVKGVTPLTIRLDKGAHVLEVQSGKSEPRVIPLMIQGGVQTSQYVELAGSAATGALEIVSQPPGARIIIDGQSRGTTPSTVRDLSPGDHSVVLELRDRKVTQAVKIQAGSTSKLSVPIK